VSRALEVIAGVQRRVPFGVALTLDEPTDDVLAALRALDARATFFLADVDRGVVQRLRTAGHGIGWRTEAAHDDLVRIEGRVVRLNRPPAVPSTVADALRLRRRRLDSWLWSLEEDDLDRVREPEGVRVVAAVDRAVTVVRARGLELVAL
jgi:hypothetical protein